MPEPKSKKTEQQASEPEVETTEVISYPEGTLGHLIAEFNLSGKKLPLGISAKGKPYCIIKEGIILVFLASCSNVEGEKATVEVDKATQVQKYQPKDSKSIVYTVGSNLNAGFVQF